MQMTSTDMLQYYLAVRLPVSWVYKAVVVCTTDVCEVCVMNYIALAAGCPVLIELYHGQACS